MLILCVFSIPPPFYFVSLFFRLILVLSLCTLLLLLSLLALLWHSFPLPLSLVMLLLLLLFPLLPLLPLSLFILFLLILGRRFFLLLRQLCFLLSRLLFLLFLLDFMLFLIFRYFFFLVFFSSLSLCLLGRLSLSSFVGLFCVFRSCSSLSSSAPFDSSSFLTLPLPWSTLPFRLMYLLFRIDISLTCVGIIRLLVRISALSLLFLLLRLLLLGVYLLAPLSFSLPSGPLPLFFLTVQLLLLFFLPRLPLLWLLLLLFSLWVSLWLRLLRSPPLLSCLPSP